MPFDIDYMRYSYIQASKFFIPNEYRILMFRDLGILSGDLSDAELNKMLELRGIKWEFDSNHEGDIILLYESEQQREAYFSRNDICLLLKISKYVKKDSWIQLQSDCGIFWKINFKNMKLKIKDHHMYNIEVPKSEIAITDFFNIKEETC